MIVAADKRLSGHRVCQRRSFQNFYFLKADFLGREAEARRAGVEEFCQGLAARLARLESAAG